MNVERKKCCYSNHGKIRLNPRFPNRRGIVISQTKDECLLILWDGLKSLTSYHKSFIEILPDEDEIEFCI